LSQLHFGSSRNDLRLWIVSTMTVTLTDKAAWYFSNHDSGELSRQ
jgi:hypothetical protein